MEACTHCECIIPAGSAGDPFSQNILKQSTLSIPNKDSVQSANGVIWSIHELFHCIYQKVPKHFDRKVFESIKGSLQSKSHLSCSRVFIIIAYSEKNSDLFSFK